MAVDTVSPATPLQAVACSSACNDGSSARLDHRILRRALNLWHCRGVQRRRHWTASTRARAFAAHRRIRAAFNYWRIALPAMVQRRTLASSYLKRCCFLAWCSYTSDRKQRAEVAKAARELNEFMIWRSTFWMWRRIADTSRENRGLEIRALRMWAHVMRKKYWSAWNQRIRQRKQIALRLLHLKPAVIASLRKLAVIRTWKRCLDSTRTSHQLFRTFKLRRGLRRWYSVASTSKLSERRALSLQKEIVQMRLKNVWVRYAASSKACQAREVTIDMLAETHWNHCIRSWCIRSWTTYSSVRRCSRLKLRVFNAARLRRLLLQWKSRANEEAEERACASLAFLHYNQKLMQNVMNRWHTNVTVERNERVQAGKALYYFHHTLLRRCVKEWSSFVRRLKLFATGSILSQRHRKRNAVIVWKVFTRARLDRQLSHRGAVRWSYLRTLKRSFSIWKLAFKRVFLLYLRLDQFLGNVWRLRMLRQFLGIWATLERDCSSMRLQRGRAAFFWRVKLQQHSMKEWKRFVQAERLEREKSCRASVLWTQILQRRAFRMWDAYTYRSICRRRELNELLLRHQRATISYWKLRFNWTVWQEVYRKIIHQRSLERLFYDRWRESSLRMVISVLHDRIQRRRHSHNLESIAVDFERSHVLRKGVQGWYNSWLTTMTMRFKNITALRHWSGKLLEHVFARWRQYIFHRREKASRYAEALNSRRQELIRETVRRWFQTAGRRRERLVERMQADEAQRARRIIRLVSKIVRHWRIKSSARKHGEKIPQPLLSSISKKHIEPYTTPASSSSFLPSIRHRRPPLLIDEVSCSSPDVFVNTSVKSVKMSQKQLPIRDLVSREPDEDDGVRTELAAIQIELERLQRHKELNAANRKKLRELTTMPTDLDPGLMAQISLLRQQCFQYKTYENIRKEHVKALFARVQLLTRRLQSHRSI